MLPQTVIARVVSVSEVLMSKVLLSKVPSEERGASYPSRIEVEDIYF
jgi:hypothetical protein